MTPLLRLGAGAVAGIVGEHVLQLHNCIASKHGCNALASVMAALVMLHKALGSLDGIERPSAMSVSVLHAITSL